MKTLGQFLSKNIIAACALAVLSFYTLLFMGLNTPQVYAAADITYVATSVPENVSITNTFLKNATQTVNLGNTITLTQYDTLGCFLDFQGNNTATGNVTVSLVRSYDGTNWETTPKISWIVPMNNTTRVVGYTNLDVAVIGSAPYLKVTSIANSDTVADATNCSLKVVKKRKPVKTF